MWILNLQVFNVEQAKLSWVVLRILISTPVHASEINFKIGILAFQRFFYVSMVNSAIFFVCIMKGFTFDCFNLKLRIFELRKRFGSRQIFFRNTA